MKVNRPICLTIAGLDPSGGAGILADVSTFQAFKCRAAAAVTSITFQNSNGVYGVANQSGENIRGQLDPIFSELNVAAVKIGLVPTADAAVSIASVLRSNNVKNIVIDPVISSTSGSELADNDAVEAMGSELFPLAMLITPNIAEAERLASITLSDESALHDAAKIMKMAGALNVLIKGGHFEPESQLARDFLFTGDEVRTYQSQRIQNVSVRGTGCMLSSAITANLALSQDLRGAIKIAKDYVYGVIAAAADEA